jgi:hypothetical protein
MVNNLRINLFLLLGAMVVAVSCTQENEPVSSGPVSLKARIADETRATLSETDGTFAFSSGDAIKVFNGSGVYASTSITVDETEASFTMGGGFTDSGSGFAAYPAAIVSGITASGVTFALPTTYTYEQVGGSDASASQVPCPMVAAYTAGQDLVFKQAGAVVRFRVKNCLAGTLTFTFKSQVTGMVTVSAVPTGANDGILAENFSNDTEGGYSITVTGVPAVSGTDVIYVTLPVPVGTDPINVSVWNDGSTAGRFRTLTGDPVPLNRAGGYKRGVALQDRSESMTFGGLSIAGFLYNHDEESNDEKYYGLLTDPLELLKHYNHNYTDAQYYFCWNDIVYNIPKLFTAEGITIGDYKYDVPTGGKSGQWNTIVGTTRTGATVNSVPAHYAFVTVTGLTTPTYPVTSIRGLLLFPDDAQISVTNGDGVSLTYFDAASTTNSNTITVSVLRDLEAKGCVFLPAAGYSEIINKEDTWGDLHTGGYYWSRTNYSATYAYALAFTYDGSKYTLAPKNSIDKKDIAYFPICLIRCD